MPDFTSQVYFRHMNGTQGWSEVYYQTAADHAAAITEFIALLNIRLDLLSQDCEINYAKVSDFLIRGDAKMLSPFVFPAPGTDSGSGAINDPNVAALVRQETETGVHGMRPLRGIADDFIVAGVLVPDADWLTAFGLFAARLTSGPWNLKAKDPLGGVTFLTLSNVILRDRITRRATGRPFDSYRGRQHSP